jgi:hypothetical protein
VRIPSIVVLPLPAPPDTTMLARPRTHDSRKRIIRGPTDARSTNSSGVMGAGENLRIVSVGPRSERGGTIAWTREPSGSRASTHGDA